MLTNRIREHREARGLTMEQVAELIGTSTSTVNRLEKGGVELVSDWIMKLAEAFGCDWIELVRDDVRPQPEAATTGLAETAEPFKAAPGHPLHAGLGEHESLFRVRDAHLENLGIYEGDIIVADVSTAAVRAVQTGDIVVLQAYGPGLTEARTLVREFVAPSKLICNSPATAMPELDTLRDPVAIKGVAKRRFGALKRT